MDRVFGGFFRVFNKVFHSGSENYGRGVTRVIGRKAMMMGLYAVLLGGAVFMSHVVPGGFVPAQDKEYLVSFAQLPNGASRSYRTEDVIREMSAIALKQPGVESAVEFPGLSVNGFTNSSSAGIVFVTLKPFDERKGEALSAGAIAGALNQKFSAMKGASSRCSRRRRCSASARSAASRCSSRTAARSAIARSTRPRRPSSRSRAGRPS